MPRKSKCPDCGEYHTEITIPSWLEAPLNYMLMLAGPDTGVARIEAINEILAEPDARHMSMSPLAHFVLHCAQGSAMCARTWGGKYKATIDWNEAILNMLQKDMTHFVQNDNSLRELALAHPNEMPGLRDVLSAPVNVDDDEWFKAVTRAHFYSVCLDMVGHDEVGSKMYSVMATALIGNNSLALTRSRFNVSDSAAIAKVELVIGEYRRVALETLDSVISSFNLAKVN